MWAAIRGESVRNILFLIVEDEPLIQMDLEATLEEAGYATEAAHSGEAAISKLQGRPDIRGLVTDINLSGPTTGWEVARRARELFPDLPVVYVTSVAANEWTSKGVPKSVLVEKPFTAEQITTAISTLIAGIGANTGTELTPEVTLALSGTVERWRGIAGGWQFDGGREGCPLCSFIDPINNGCVLCPVRQSTGLDECHGTPYWSFEKFLITHRANPDHFDGEGRPVSVSAKSLARAEYDFLRSLLPPNAPGFHVMD